MLSALPTLFLSCMRELHADSLLTGPIPKLSFYEHFQTLTLWAIQNTRNVIPDQLYEDAKIA